MTDTDLTTAGGAENQDLPTTVTSDIPSPEATKAASGNPLSAMVLPELRALASRVGVKGASGMRKNELIAAIREHEGL
ncbi:MAG: Rho termination factor N-terminal domain-containing protein, partial [Mycobacteriaceae bacterium]|nr:Rho termination factor N-terminal domain-containing protein [Mycobacteriaceae bacterium]